MACKLLWQARREAARALLAGLGRVVAACPHARRRAAAARLLVRRSQREQEQGQLQAQAQP